VRNDDFEALTQRIVERVRDDDRVLGLVMLGSAADASRRDIWSDHDFFLITRPGEQETFRNDLWWLADDAEIAGTIRETAHGVQVILRDGHLLEFAVFDPDEIFLGRVNARAVVLDKADIGERIEQVAAYPVSTRPINEATFLFISHVLVGVGRFRRGEVIAARNRLTAIAVPQLITALLQHKGLEPPDGYDLTRRIETVLPDEAAAIAAALAQADLNVVGAQLLNIAATVLGAREDFPREMYDAVRSRLIV
jgi:hypothetical protein